MRAKRFSFWPNLENEEELRALLAALRRWGFSIDEVPRPEVREKLRELESRDRQRATN